MLTKTLIGMTDKNGMIVGGSIDFKGTRLDQLAEKDWLAIRGKRIAMAEQMIRTTAMQISEIAANVGFYDYNYFSKVFHRKFGCSPREYRKRLESSGEAAEKE